MQQQQQDWNRPWSAEKQLENNTISKYKYSRPEKQAKIVGKDCLLKKKKKNAIRSPENQSIDKIKKVGDNVEGRPQILCCI